MTAKKLAIAVAKGDGIGPEIMTAVIDIFKAAKVPLDFRMVDMGKDVYLAGQSNGMVTLELFMQDSCSKENRGKSGDTIQRSNGDTKRDWSQIY